MSSDANVAVMNQFVDKAVVGEASVVQTALAYASVDAAVESKTRATNATVVLAEAGLTGLLVLRAGLASSALSKALQATLKLTLPDRLQSSQTSTCCIRWMAPDEWLLSCPVEDCFSIEQQLRAAFAGNNEPVANAHISIVNVSGGYTVLTLSGADASKILKKSMAYDISPENFPTGKVVNTTLAKAQVTLRALTDTRYELLIRRSFSDYVWLWLQRAGTEYGLGAIVRGGS